MVTLSDLQNEELARDLAPQYWEKTGLPDLTRAERGRVVLSGFSVEFIAAKKEGFFKRQPFASAPPISPFGVGVELSGLGRKRILFTEEVQLDVIESLRDQLIDLFEREYGYEVVPHLDVLASEAYQKFEFLDIDATGGRGTFQQANLISSDTGTVRAAELRPATGYRLLNDNMDSEMVREIGRELAAELGADAAIRVRMRVGIYRGLAALEKGSRVEMSILPRDDRPGATGVMEMRRSMLSEQSVSSFDSFVPFQGERREVVGDAFVDAISEILGVSLDLFNRVLRGSIAERTEDG